MSGVRFPPAAPNSSGERLRQRLAVNLDLRHKCSCFVHGQASGASATVTRSTLGTGQKANQGVDPPEWLGNGNLYRQDRGHPIARQLGGSARTNQEMVTLDQRINRAAMARFEREIARRARGGEVVEYWVNPLYGADRLAPTALALSAAGTRGEFSARVISNPKSRGR
jgi:hypothetical protein